MLKTIFFDIGNVLVFFDLSKMQKQIAACTGLSLDTIRKIILEEEVQKKYESGQINSLAFHQIFQKRSSKKFTLEALLEATSDIFRPNEALWPLVNTLKEAGLRLIFLSNTSECHFNHLSSIYPIFHIFDDRVLSFEVGALKPDKQIFIEALSRALCDPKECFYIDDIPEFVKTAKECGLDSEIFTTTQALQQALIHRGISLSGFSSSPMIGTNEV